MKKRIISLTMAASLIIQSISTVSINTTVIDTTKNINNIVIFLDFNDTDSFNGDIENAQKIESTFNDFVDDDNDKLSNEDKFSLKSYFYDITKGKTIVDSHFYPKSDNGLGYESYRYTQDKSVYEKIYMGTQDERDVLIEAFNGVKDQIDLSPEELDSNNDGKIDAVTFVFSGVPNVSGGSMLRPHKSEMSASSTTLNGKKLGTYNIIGEGSRNINIYNKNILGTIVHEFLHIVGYPDLYKDSALGSLVGIWDIMGESKLMPQLPTVYSRNKYGNSNLEVVEITKSGTYTLNTASNLNCDGPVAFKIASPKYPDEYFIIEYRKNDKKWDEKLPSSGIIVYRIDESIRADYGNNYEGIHMYMFRPEAEEINSALGEINNATLSEESGRVALGTVSESAFDIDLNSIYHTDGSNSNIVISNVGSASGDSITFDIKLHEEVDAIKGSGTANDPYQISNPNHINQMKLTPNKYFILTENIDLSGIVLEPIGNFDNPFSGVLDGKGYTISNLCVDSDNDEVGFVGVLGANGVIKNTNFKNINIKTDNSNGYIGGIAGASSGTIENISVSGVIEGNTNFNAGGIVGYNNYRASTINNKCSVKIISKGIEQPYVGGIIGYAADSLVKNNYFDGVIQANGNSYVGAIYGTNMITEDSNKVGSIDNVYNITKSGVDIGIGKIQEAIFGGTDEGLVGIELLENTELNKGEVSKDIVIYNDELVDGVDSITSSNTEIAIVENNKIEAVAKGDAVINYKLTLGSNIISEDIKVKVSDNSIVEVDKSQLQSEIDICLEINKDNYTKKSVETLEASLQNAIEIINNIEATQDEVNENLVELINAKNSLIIKTENKPTIKADNIELKVGDEFNPLIGVTATDVEDGDLTSSIEVAENTVDTNKAGAYKVVYSVTDSDENTTTKEISVEVYPRAEIINKIPVITAKDITIKVGDTFIATDYATANDKEDGDITNKIVVSGEKVDTTKVGSYKVTYTVTDSQGATTSKTITVIVRSNSKPVISSGDIKIQNGGVFNPLHYVSAKDIEDGDITNRVSVIKNTVDMDKVGEYEVVYSVTDSDNNTTTKAIKVTVTNKNTDVNNDGKVNQLDLDLVASMYGKTKEDEDWNEKYDINGDDIIDIYDFVLISKNIK